MSKSIDERKSLTFRAAEDLLEPPALLEPGDLDDHLRKDLWDNVYLFLDSGRVRAIKPAFHSDIEATVVHLFRRVFDDPLDDALRKARDPDYVLKTFKYTVLSNDYGVCLELIQELLRRRADDVPLCRAIKAVFDQSRSPYLLVDDPPTLVPRGLMGEGQGVAMALNEIGASTASGAKSHLLLATDAINNSDWRGAVRESIHAVESAAKRLTGKPNAMNRPGFSGGCFV